ncbi:MAG: PIN domain-containing protein [Rhodospirillaceae bacterium]|nr:PIN domain-containing protein [Rhodospirillaceae bacterium]
MSVERCFVDTNVLIYLFDNDSPSKQARAQALLDEERDRIVLSTQVLGEFYVNVARKLEQPLPQDAAARAVEDFSRFDVQSVTAELVLAAVSRSRSSLLSYWDSLIVETARNAGAKILFTEDLQHGQEIDGLRIVNPFVNADP